MNPRVVERLPVTLTFTIDVINPFIADFSFAPFELDLSSLESQQLKDLKSFVIAPVDTGQIGNDNLSMKAVFEYSIRKESKHYLKFVEARDVYGPLGVEKVLSAQKAINALVIDLIKYISWRKGLEIAYSQLDRLKITWRWDSVGASSDDPPKVTYRLRSLEHLYFTTKEKVSLVGSDFNDFLSLNGENGAIPLHQELLMEVDRLRKGKYNRSAYLILYSALEVATKGLVSHRFPDTAWLVGNLASPDLVKMYREFINEKIAPILNKGDLELLKDINTKRNKIAHTGEAVQIETLDKHFNHIKRWLNKIDVAFGYEWAANNSDSPTDHKGYGMNL